MRIFWPATSRSFGLARLPSMRSSPLRTMRWICVKASCGKARHQEAVDAHIGLVRLDLRVCTPVASVSLAAARASARVGLGATSGGKGFGAGLAAVAAAAARAAGAWRRLRCAPSRPVFAGWWAAWAYRRASESPAACPTVPWYPGRRLFLNRSVSCAFGNRAPRRRQSSTRGGKSKRHAPSAHERQDPAARPADRQKRRSRPHRRAGRPPASPRSHSSTASREKAEKVVKPPRIPVVEEQAAEAGSSLAMRLEGQPRRQAGPSAKEPTMLTASVPQGNAVPQERARSRD